MTDNIKGWSSNNWPLNVELPNIYLWGFWKKVKNGEFRQFYTALMRETNKGKDEVLQIWKHDKPITEKQYENMKMRDFFPVQDEKDFAENLKINGMRL